MQALRPAPGPIFWRKKMGEKFAGETPVPLSVRHNGYARKISLRGSPRLEREIFPLARMPSRGCKAFIFLGIPTQEQGEF